MIEHDGHIHSPYCPHGSSDTFESYCEQAIRQGLKGITFTEHAPLPRGFVDPTPQQDSGMKLEDLTSYVETIQALKEKYRNRLNVLLGLEVDYIEGFEAETKAFLQQYGPLLDDGILSVHFLKAGERYICMDYAPESFRSLVEWYGSIDDVYRHYYETVRKSITSDLGHYKPKRLGHLTLVRKFQKKFTPSSLFEGEIRSLLKLIKRMGYSLDYNGAGVLKPLCGEPYPYKHIAVAANELGIPLIYGSDAHQVRAMQAGSNS